MPPLSFSPSPFLQVLYETSSDEEDEEGGEVEGSEGPSPSADGLVDLEDIGKVMSKMTSAKQRRRVEEEAIRSGKMEPREMVTPALRKALTKQGRHALCGRENLVVKEKGRWCNDIGQVYLRSISLHTFNSRT